MKFSLFYPIAILVAYHARWSNQDYIKKMIESSSTEDEETVNRKIVKYAINDAKMLLGEVRRETEIADSSKRLDDAGE